MSYPSLQPSQGLGDVLPILQPSQFSPCLTLPPTLPGFSPCLTLVRTLPGSGPCLTLPPTLPGSHQVLPSPRPSQFSLSYPWRDPPSSHHVLPSPNSQGLTMSYPPPRHGENWEGWGRVRPCLTLPQPSQGLEGCLTHPPTLPVLTMSYPGENPPRVWTMSYPPQPSQFSPCLTHPSNPPRVWRDVLPIPPTLPVLTMSYPPPTLPVLTMSYPPSNPPRVSPCLTLPPTLPVLTMSYPPSRPSQGLRDVLPSLRTLPVLTMSYPPPNPPSSHHVLPIPPTLPGSGGCLTLPENPPSSHHVLPSPQPSQFSPCLTLPQLGGLEGG